MQLAMSPWELINSALAMAQEAMKRLRQSSMRLDLTIQKPTMKAYGRNIQTGSFMVLKPLLRRGHGALTIILKRNG